MKYNISLLCILLSGATFIHSADRDQITNPLGLQSTTIATNSTRETVTLTISLIGLGLISHRTASLQIKPNQTVKFTHPDDTRFSGVLTKASKPVVDMCDAPTVGTVAVTWLPTGMRFLTQHVVVLYAAPKEQIGIGMDITNSCRNL